jgi:hypothetical protein
MRACRTQWDDGKCESMRHGYLTYDNDIPLAVGHVKLSSGCAIDAESMYQCRQAGGCEAGYGIVEKAWSFSVTS